MEVEVGRELCEANGVCVGLAPEVFSLDDDEVLHVRGHVEPNEEERVRKAVRLCPKGALSIPGD